MQGMRRAGHRLTYWCSVSRYLAHKKASFRPWRCCKSSRYPPVSLRFAPCQNQKSVFYICTSKREILHWSNPRRNSSIDPTATHGPQFFQASPRRRMRWPHGHQSAPSSCRAAFCRASRSSPSSKWSKCRSMPNFRATVSITRRPSGMASLPMPSSATPAMQCFAIQMLLKM